MPGLFGSTGHTQEHTTLFPQLIAQVQSNDKQNPFLQIDAVFSDEQVVGYRSHLGLIGDKISPTSSQYVHVWTHGEAQIGRKKSLGELLLHAYEAGTLAETLKNLDGYFCAVVYDAKQGQLHFVSDRFGMKHLYIAKQADRLSWANEYKYFECLPTPFTPNADYEASMLGHGFMVGNGARHKEIYLLPASSIHSYDVKSLQLTKETRYWSWSDIPKLDLSFETATTLLAEQLKKAAANNLQDEQRYAVALSGGIDSRYLFACAQQTQHTIAFTFGSPKSTEVTIARKVAALGTIPYSILDINNQNWFDQRMEAIRKTDGFLNAIDLHFGQYHSAIKKKADVLLNGFAGGVIAGGCALSSSKTALNDAYALKWLGDQAAFTNPSDPFYDGRTDAFNIDIRQRRFTQVGTQHTAHLFEDRRPFLDIELINTIYGVPDEYRRNYKLYHAALLKAFPRWYSNIPWHYTNAPISDRAANFSVLQLKFRSIQRRLNMLPANYDNDHYPTWIQQNQFVDVFIGLVKRFDADKKNKPLQSIAQKLTSKRTVNARIVMAYLTIMHTQLSDKGALARV